MKSTNLRGPHLIVSPLSLLRQWESELTTWAPDINCIVLHGNGEARDLILEHEFYYQEPFVSKAEAAALKRASSYKFDVILTTYEVVMRDLRVFQKIDWKMLIVDEAHKLKNNTSKIYEMMISIPREHCVMLTGTPLQNKTEELWALLHFADSRKFNDLGEFSRQFGDMRGASDVAQFHAVVKPFLLRRIKEDVEKSLPPKEEIIIEVTLTKMQKQFYRAIYERNTAFLFRGAKASNGPSLMNVTMELRKCCNHPYLVKGGEERAVAEIPEALRHDSTALHNKLIESCGKMVLLDKLLPRLYKEGHKVLIFSQMVRVLNLLEDFLRYRGYTFERLDGTSRSMDRHTSVERFKNRSNNIFVMLLSTKAGGLGLNLTAADTVIIYDSDWNPHNDMQAQARAHRIGQTRSVSIYRLITKKTYEMHMFHRASLKLGLDRAVLAHARSEQEGYESSKNPSTKEIDELLKRGAYDVFREDDTEQNEFVEADIDSIMQMSSHKIVYGSNSESNISSSLGGFSKASFVSADSTEDVDINDPEFWWKTMRLVEKPVEGTMGVSEDGTPFEVGPDGELIPLQRRRRQPQMYGTDGTAMSELDKLLNDGNSEDGEKRESKKEQRERELKTWGPHSRDRMIRTLLQYGFGRWERIRKEGGAANRELSMVESLARFYVMQCGLAAGEADPNKADSPFVVDAINAAKHLQTLMASSEKSIEIPEALMEKRFQDKLKSGTARKSLMRLDFLHQLNQMISKTVHSVYESNKDTIPTPETIDMETSMTTLPIHLLANNIPLGDIRPAWTKVSPWWDDECDRHLIIGTYIYGYGKYAEMRKDSRLCFHDKITKYAQANKEAAVHDGVEAGHAVSSIYDDSAVSTFKISEDGTQCRIVIPNGRTSLFKGVFSQQGSVCWTAQIGDQQPVVIGCYNTELDAAKAYVDVAKKQGIDTTEAEKLITAAVTNADSPPLTEAPPLASGHRASKYRGVRTSGTKWTAQIFYGGTNHHLGTFATEIEAAVVYDAAAVDNHGEGATLNFNQDPSLLRKEIEFISKQPGVTIEYFSPGVEPPIVVKREAREAAFPVQADSENTEHVDLEGSNEDGEEGDDIVMFSNVKNESAGQGAKNASQKKRNRQAFSAGVDSVATLPVPAPALEMPSGVPANEGDDFDDAQGGEEQDTGGGLPDVRTLNRLLTWLVTSEAAQMSRKQIRENRAKAREKGDRTRGPGDPALMSEKREMRMKMKLAEERRGYSTTGEFGLIHHALVQSDPDSVILAYKKSLIAKCEEMVHLTMPMPTHYYAALGQLAIEDSQFMNGVTVSGRTPLRNISSVHFASTTGVNSEAVSGPDEAMQGAGSNSAASGTGAKRASMDTYVEDNTVFLSDEEVQRICAAFVVYGAPPVRKSMDLNDVFSRQYLDGVPTSYVNVSDDVALRLYSISLAMRIPEQVLQAIGIYDLDQNSRSMWPHHNIYSWRAFKLRCATCLTPIELQRFYEDHWLPFCFAVLNPPPSNTTANKLHLPNPFFRATDHSSTVRGVVEVFLLRQHVLYSIRFVTWNMMYDLIIFLRSPAGRTHMERPYFESPFPVWWCPWIHDVALLLGCLKHGYMALEAIMLDPELPFFRPILQDHIRRVFLIGFEGMPPAAPPGSFRDGWEAELWVQQVSLMMPEMRDLENRMLFVLTRVTARLPQHHFAYVRTAGSQPLTPAEHEMSLHIDQGRYPGVPMASYLDATSKRRRMDIQERFQDAMSRY
jgi:chromodomain-helicase-DNA-binding protein 7